jgi:hypothetical protein
MKCNLQMFLILEQIIVVFYLRSYLKKCKTITLIDFKTKIKNQKDVINGF